MNTISRTITGIIIFIFGLFLLKAFLYGDIWTSIWGFIITIIGIIIFFNKKEDDIEKIKN